MYSRLTELSVKPDKVKELRQALDNDVIPTLKKQPGFVDAVETVDPSSGRFVCMTLWKTRDDAERWGNETLPKLAPKLESLLAGDIRSQTLQVATSTAHNVRATAA